MDMVNNMTEWIERDAQIKEIHHETESPETSTMGEVIVADPDGMTINHATIQIHEKMG